MRLIVSFQKKLITHLSAKSMEEEYEIPVVYKNQQLYFKAIVLTLGLYIKKIRMNVNGT